MAFGAPERLDCAAPIFGSGGDCAVQRWETVCLDVPGGEADGDDGRARVQRLGEEVCGERESTNCIEHWVFWEGGRCGEGLDALVDDFVHPLAYELKFDPPCQMPHPRGDLELGALCSQYTAQDSLWKNKG